MGRDDPPRLVGQPAPAPYEEPPPAAAADVDEQANSVFVGGVPNTITLALLTELRTLDVTNPSTGKVIRHVADASAGDVERAIAAAQAASIV